MKSRLGSLFSHFGHQLKQNWWGVLIGVTVPTILGLILLIFPVGRKITNASYNFFFPARGTIPVNEVELVYLDDASHVALNQPYNAAWDRRLHADLIDTLTDQGAKAVVMDIIFSGPSNQEADDALAAAIKRNGRVILAADFEVGRNGKQYFKPYSQFTNAANDRIAYAALMPDEDLMIRQYIPAFQGDVYPTEAWAALDLIGAPVSKDPDVKNRLFWLNYYGKENLPSISFFRALSADPKFPLPPDYFTNKVVFVGAKLQTKFSGVRKDEYPTPFSHLNFKFSSGVEIQATAFLNLYRGDWLRRWSPMNEVITVAAFGIFVGLGLVLCRPALAVTMGVVAGFALSVGFFILFKDFNTWFPWMILVFVQLPLALLWSISYNSMRLYVEKRLLEQTLEKHLSPKRVKQLVNRKALLNPGAEKQMLTVLFSDIENFTMLSEGVDSGELAKLMNRYFESAVTNCVFKTDGFVVKYIGDAIFSFWNAPEEQQNHAAQACEAALLLSKEAISIDKGGQKLHCRTRVGLHTGVANVGNFGSATRIDYTAIGENINLASRMEGLNKYLGTSVLITGHTKKDSGDRFVTRFCGRFRLKGFEKAVEVYELIGMPDAEGATKPWRESFAAGLAAFKGRNFNEAERHFRCTIELHPNDGPSKFYLREIEDLRKEPLDDDWNGDVELKDK